MSRARAGKERQCCPFAKVISAIVVVMMVTGCFVVSESDDSKAAGPTSGNCGDNLQWEIDTSTGHLTITGTGAMYDYTYDAIRWNGNTIKSVTLPDGLTTIGTYAFQNCCDLTSITIPSSVITIGDRAFLHCHNLASVILGNNVNTIRHEAFGHCTSLMSISFPDSLTTIGNGAFQNCHSLETITIGGNITTIGGGAFSRCIKMKSFTVTEPNSAFTSEDGVLFNNDKSTLIKYPGGKTNDSYTIPLTVHTVDSYAFDDCTNLKSLEITDNVGVFSGFSLYYCTNLERVTVSGSNTSFSSENGVLFDHAKQTLIHYPVGKKGTSYNVPASVKTIGSLAFQNNDKLVSVTIQNGVTTIEQSAFRGCNNLESVSLPDTVESIEYGAFSSCFALKSITIPAKVTVISGSSFAFCYGLKTVIFTGGVTTIGDSAFSYCNGLRTISLPSTLKSIGPLAFSYCSGLESVTIPDGVTTIGNGAFMYCSGLKTVNIGNSTAAIGEGPFLFCNRLESFQVSGTNTAYCSEDGVLFNKEKTKLIKYPAGKTGDSYTVPSTVNTIGKYAFDSSSGLTAVSIGSGVTMIEDGAFLNCSNIRSFSVPKGNTTYCTADGVVLNKTKTTLIQYPAGKTDDSYSVPSTVTSINPFAFSSSSKLSKIALPDNLTSIGNGAFYNCYGMASIHIPAKVTSIGDSAFEGCSALESFSVSGDSNSYCTVDGVLYSKDKSSLIWCPYKYTGSLLIPYNTDLNITLSNLPLCEGITEFVTEGSSSLYTKDGVLLYYTYLLSYPAGSEMDQYTFSPTIYTLNYTVSSSFYHATNLKEIKVEEGNANHSSKDGCLYDRSGRVLITCPSGMTEFESQSNLKSIAPIAFSGNNLETVTFKSGTDMTVQLNAFYNCSSLKKIIIEEGADINFAVDSIVFTDDEEHTIYVIAPEGYELDTSNFRSNIKIVYSEPSSGHNNLWLFIGGGAIGLIVLAGAALFLIRHH